MKTNLENYSNKELFVQILKNIGRSFWNCRLMFPFKRRWNSSSTFRNRFIGWSIFIILIIIIWFIVIPVMQYITDFVNYVYWGITPVHP